MKQLLIILCSILFIIDTSYCQNKKAFVKTIYPTTDSIPENILRFYVEFSEPIREENALSHIHLTAAGGKNISVVFFDNNYEIWNAERTKLTLILDPGRVKTGLKANEQLGRVFNEGTGYSFTIDSLFTTMGGKHLANKMTKKFIAVKEDTIAPVISYWKIINPVANTLLPVIVYFKESIDHISALSYLIITDSNGKKINGKICLKGNESVWEFTPALPWKKGNYRLMVNERLEDIAANNLNGSFDHFKGTLKNSKEGSVETVIIKVE